MDDQQKRKPLFWPALFLGAFALGGILWCVWMWLIVQKTRAIHDNDFFVPMAGQTAPKVPTTNSDATTNSVPAGVK